MTGELLVIPPPILQASQLVKDFPLPASQEKVRVLQGVSLDVLPGNSIAIMGRSGEGKTTLLHILGTLEASDSGTLFIEGKKVYERSGNRLRNEKIGFIFQSHNLLEDMTLIENLLLPLAIGRKKLTSYLRQYAFHLLEEVGLLKKVDVPVRYLSGGEKQRAAIARALVNDQKLIFADEPTGNLDRENAENIYRLLFSFIKTRGITLILATHDLYFAKLCDRSFMLERGKLLPVTP